MTIITKTTGIHEAPMEVPASPALIFLVLGISMATIIPETAIAMFRTKLMINRVSTEAMQWNPEDGWYIFITNNW